MTTSAFTTRGAPRLTYARARLWLGISGVGTAVLTASLLLGLGVPSRILPTSTAQPLPDALASLVLPLLVVQLVFLPFDLLGGAIVVREPVTLSRFVLRWTRGAIVQLATWLLAAAVLLLAARAAARPGAIVTFVALQLALAFLRLPLARAIAPFRRLEVPERLRALAAQAGIDPQRIVLVDTADEGFVGGWSGLAARRLMLPALWLQLPDDALVAVLRRRRLVAESGAHRRGVLGAIAWNTLGFAVVLALTSADLGAAAGVFTLAAGMTLWAFVGALILPTPSRAAVLALDARAARDHGVAALQDAITRLDRWQDDEATRPPGVEAIFHPVPARAARLERLNALAGDGAAAPSHGGNRRALHHLARHALWLGWGALSPLSRLVHCNVGRPALWAILPGD